MESNDGAMIVQENKPETGGIILAPEAVMKRVTIIHDFMKHNMESKKDYDTIPGTQKPTLLLPGAEKIRMMFGFADKYEIQYNHMNDGHREVIVTCSLYNHDGVYLGGGIGSCSTMESKYRYRKASSSYEVQDSPVPADYWDNKSKYKGYGSKKIDGVWKWVKYGDAERIENPDIADVYNTVLKMAKKRALVDAVKTVTGSSDLFTQDTEDFKEADEDNNTVHDAKPIKEGKNKIEDELKSRVTKALAELEITKEEAYEKIMPMPHTGAELKKFVEELERRVSLKRDFAE